MHLLPVIACLLAFAAVLGCSSLPATSSTPDDIVFSVADIDYACASLPDTIDVGISISNQGPGTFRTYLGESSGPPYELSWLSYSVMRDSPSGSEVEWNHGAGGHGPLPQNTLAIGPNDSTRVFARLYATSQMDKIAAYRIQIDDQDDQIYLTNAFTICQR